MSKKAYFGLVILTVVIVLVVLLIGYLIWGETLRIPHKFKYDILKDTLTIVLAIVAIAITAGSGLVYMIINSSIKRNVEDVRKEAMSAFETQRLRSMCLSHVSSGYGWWTSYQRSGEETNLNEAIRETEFAYSKYAVQLDEKDPDNQLIICAVENNLAYYYAERQLPQDKDLARQYAEHLKSKIPKHPYERVTWEDTYNFVMQQYP